MTGDLRTQFPRLDAARGMTTAALVFATTGDIDPLLALCADLDAEIGRYRQSKASASGLSL